MRSRVAILFVFILSISVLLIFISSDNLKAHPNYVEYKTVGVGASDKGSLYYTNCYYKEIPGIATIKEIKKADPSEYNCKNDPVTVVFDFAPNDSSLKKSNDHHLTIGAGMNPPRKWVQQQKITEESEHPCIRKEISIGTCTPVVFKFTKLDFNDALNMCWE